MCLNKTIGVMAWLMPAPSLSERSTLKFTPTLISATLAGAVAGTVMPVLWSRLDDDSTGFVLAFLLVVALPAHAFVVGFGINQGAHARGVDTDMLKRVGAWIASAVLSAALLQAITANT